MSQIEIFCEFYGVNVWTRRFVTESFIAKSSFEVKARKK